MKYLIRVLIVPFLIVSCTIKKDVDDEKNYKPIKVEIKKEEQGYKLYRGGKPYTFNGAGLDGDIKNLISHGGNSIRTWNAGNDRQTGIEILDEAFENDMTVLMCFYMQPERHGMDYDNQTLVDQQFEKIKKVVLEHKDHPALLAWCIGNEMNHSYSNPKVFDAVNDISKWIHDIDTNHPTTTAIASFDPKVVLEVKKRATDIDFLSIQVYGELFVIQDLIKETEWTKPYMITEWGAIGHWEMPATSWGAPIEQTSSAKADNYLKGYRKSIENYSDQCIGNYVFLWGQKQERTPTWYGMFLESGEETEAVDVMHFIWNNKWPENRTPRLDSLKVDGKQAQDNVYLKPGEKYKGEVFVRDFDNDQLTYKWEIKKESTADQEGGDEEYIPKSILELFSDEQSELVFEAPSDSGAYRFFVYVFDGKGHAAHANLPFYVN